MKNIIPFIIVLFASCGSTKTLNYSVKDPVLLNTLNCPENGICSLELIPNKAIEFKTDEFGNLYPTISEGENTILKYTYKKNPLPNTEDSNYTELIYAELDSIITETTLTDNDLQNVKLHFGRLCYCKGETGYYPIKNGEFKILKSTKNTMQISLEFKITEVPQIISKINEIISLK